MWQERLSEFVTLFLVIDPVGVIPSYLGLVHALRPASQRRIAISAVMVAFVVLVFFIFVGGFVLQHMGIPLRAFQIAGGIVLFVVALEMVRGEHPLTTGERKSSFDLAVYPLAIPKIAGPGAMLAVILVTDDDRGNVWEQLATVGVLAVVMAIQLVLLFAAVPIFRVIGQGAANVIGRIMGLLLAALAVSFVLTAIGQWLNLPTL
jgi:multiple antibiotic resistance protein